MNRLKETALEKYYQFRIKVIDYRINSVCRYYNRFIMSNLPFYPILDVVIETFQQIADIETAPLVIQRNKLRDKLSKLQLKLSTK